jgi:hypothetical protein
MKKENKERGELKKKNVEWVLKHQKQKQQTFQIKVQQRLIHFQRFCYSFSSLIINAISCSEK